MHNGSDPVAAATTPAAARIAALVPAARAGGNGRAVPKPQGWELWRPVAYKAYATGVLACLAGSFIESFHNLVDFAHRNGYAGLLSLIAPLMVDIVTLGGEGLVLFAYMEGWGRREKAAGWAATVLGLAVSVAGNVGKDGWTVRGPHGHPVIPWQHVAAFAVPPLAMAGMLALALLIVKRAWKTGVTSAYLELPEHALAALHHFPEVLAGGEVPGVPAIKRTAGCGQARAQLIRDYLAGLKGDLTAFAEAGGDGGAGA